MNADNEVPDFNLNKFSQLAVEKIRFIFFIVILFLTISISISLLLPNKYKSFALLTSPASSGNQLSTLSSGISGLAGIGLGDVLGDNTKLEVGIEMMKSYSFFKNFITKDKNFFYLVAVNGWDEDTNTLKIDNEIYDSAKKEWISDLEYSVDGKPSLQYAHEIFLDNFNAQIDVTNGIVNISVIHYSPFIAKNFVSDIVEEINTISRKKVIETSSRQIDYLQKELINNQSNELKQGISELIENQIEIIAIANSSPDYLFRIIAEPYASEEHHSPGRLIIIISSFFIGIISALIAIIIANRKIVFNK
jgi:hypothetical protein